MLRIHLKYYLRKLRPTMLIWSKSGWQLPAPAKVKKQVLLRYQIPMASWIETGTYLGETSSFLAKNSDKQRVYSLEPSLDLYRFAANKWKHLPNLIIINQSSEYGFEKTIQLIDEKANFWLDGHNSGDITYLGEEFSPIKLELELINNHLPRFKEVSIFVDDVRLFLGEDGYPMLSELVKWSDAAGLNWKIEHDIFIISSSL